MSAFTAKGPVREAQISATIIRADGAIEELGVVSYYSRNPLKRLWMRLRGKGRISV